MGSTRISLHGMLLVWINKRVHPESCARDIRLLVLAFVLYAHYTLSKASRADTIPPVCHVRTIRSPRVLATKMRARACAARDGLPTKLKPGTPTVSTKTSAKLVPIIVTSTHRALIQKVVSCVRAVSLGMMEMVFRAPQSVVTDGPCRKKGAMITTRSF